MKIALILVVFSSSVIGVFGDTDKVESVSVMEGDSVTLQTGVTKIQGSDLIEWRFNGIRMARIKSDSSSTEKSFRGTVQLNSMTGDLKITNVTTTDSGLYKLNKRSRELSEMTFSVTVVISGVKSVSVKEGDSFTLNTGVNGLQRDDVIQWRHQNILVAEYNINPTYYDTNESFKLDDQTGSLTITNTRTEHAGDYEVDVTISSSRYTIHKSFSVNVNDELKSVSVMEGDSATLNSGLTEIQRDDVIHWIFGKTIIAKIIKADERFSTYDGVLDGRFRGRLKLDRQTGSLNITDTRNTDSGEYQIQISSSRFTVQKRISVTVNDELKSVSVMEGDSATLNSGLTEIQGKYLVLWFDDQDNIIAQFTGSDNVKLSNNGDLTIRNIQSNQSGYYKVNIIINGTVMKVHRRFHINISAVPDSGLSPGVVTGIVIAVLLPVFVVAVVGVIYYRHRCSKPERCSAEVNGQNDTSNKDEETELAKPAEAVEQR